MKKFICLLTLSVLMAFSLTVIAWAGYSPVLSSSNGSYVVYQYFHDHTGNHVVDVGPNATLFAYSAVVSYDSLANMCTEANGCGLTCSMYYNSSQKVYVVRVHDKTTAGELLGLDSGTYGVLANADGYVYIAKRESGNSTTIYNTYNYNQTTVNHHSMNSSGSISSPYISSSLTDHALYEKIYEKIYYINERMSIANGYLSNIGWILIDVRNYLANNMVPALSAISDNAVSFMHAVIPRLDDIYNRLYSIQLAGWASVDVENMLLASSAYIGSRVASVDVHLVDISNSLSSVIQDNKVQINTTSLESRLDKLISMYSKVNSVVLDTAGVNGGSISDAVGGELKDVVFWGDTGKSANQFLTPDGLWYRFGDNVTDTTLHTINGDIVLRSVNMGSSVPTYIVDDPILYAGVWKKGADYIISDTYNATTGEYVQRVGFHSVPNDVVLESCGRFVFSLPSHYARFTECISLSYPCFAVDQESILFATGDMVCYIHDRFFYCMDASCTDVDSFISKYSDLIIAVPFDSPIIQYFDPHTIAIPEGGSYIASYCVRITGKYETYSSFTQTADIITAINNIQFPSIGTGSTGIVDLATIEATLSTISDKLDNTASKVENTVINIASDNDAYNVFYIEGGDGNTQSVTDFAGDLTGASGRLLSLLYRLVFADALNSVDSDLDNLEEFFTSEEPVLETASIGGNATYEVVMDVWATS